MCIYKKVEIRLQGKSVDIVLHFDLRLIYSSSTPDKTRVCCARHMSQSQAMSSPLLGPYPLLALVAATAGYITYLSAPWQGESQSLMHLPSPPISLARSLAPPPLLSSHSRARSHLCRHFVQLPPSSNGNVHSVLDAVSNCFLWQRLTNLFEIAR